MVVTLNTALGIAMVLVGAALVAGIAVNLHTQRLLKRCMDILDFSFFMAARQDERNTLLDGDSNNYDALKYNEGYTKGYADGNLRV